MAEQPTSSPNQQYQCVNVHTTKTQEHSAYYLLNWINDALQSDLKTIEDLSTGAAYAQLVEILFPGTVPIKEVKFHASSQNEFEQNFYLVSAAMTRVGCDTQIPVSRLIRGNFQDNLEFLQWFKWFFDANNESRGHKISALEMRDNLSISGLCNGAESMLYASKLQQDQPLVVACLNNKGRFNQTNSEDECVSDRYNPNITYIDRSWTRKILELVGNKARLMESFSWLSTIGGGYSALGENDPKFSIRAGALSLGQQLHLAELLGDERLKVMCHLFAALAATQQNNRYFCRRYILRVILPLMNSLPYRDPILTNILSHICFRINAVGLHARNAIEEARKKQTPLDLHKSSKNQ